MSPMQALLEFGPDPNVVTWCVIRRKRCLSGRIVRKYRSLDGGWTEDTRRRWTTSDRAAAERIVALLAASEQCCDVMKVRERRKESAR